MGLRGECGRASGCPDLQLLMRPQDGREGRITPSRQNAQARTHGGSIVTSSLLDCSCMARQMCYMFFATERVYRSLAIASGCGVGLHDIHVKQTPSRLAEVGQKVGAEEETEVDD